MSKNILVVDTPQSQLHPLVQLLGEHGYLPTVLLPSDDPVAQFTAHEYELVFIALTDVDARGICSRIRQLAEGAITPVIFVGTGEEAIRTPADALGAGGDYYFKLPLDAPRVLGKVRTYAGPGGAPLTPAPPVAPVFGEAPAKPVALASAADAVLARIVHQEAELGRLAEAARQRNAFEGVRRRPPTEPADSRPDKALEQAPEAARRQAAQQATDEASAMTRQAAEEVALKTARAAQELAQAEAATRQAAEAAERQAAEAERVRAEQEQRKRRAATHAVRKAEQDARERAAAEKQEATSAVVAPAAPQAKAADLRPDMQADDDVTDVQPIAQVMSLGESPVPTSRPLRPDSGALTPQFDVAALLLQAFRQSITGNIEFNQKHQQRVLYFEAGVPVDSRSNQPFDRIEEFLHREGKITQSQLQAVRLKRLPSARQVGAYLVSAGHLKPEELFAAVRGHLEDQIYSCFEWDEATYRYHRQAAKEADRIALDVDARTLMMEGIRRKYLLPRLVARVGAPSSLLTLMEEGADDLALLRLTRAEQGVARLLDGHRSLEDVVFSGGQEALRVYQVVHALVTVGAAKVLVRGLEGLRAPDAATDAIDRERITDKLEQVRFADYFQILGIGRNATPYEVERACEHVMEEFREGRFSPEVHHAMAPQILEITEVLGEAQEVLMDPPRRLAYARHLP